MRIIFIILFLMNFTFASEVLSIKKGWQLIGVPISLDVQKHFNNKNVGIVWSYDALSQSWSGYSPDAITQDKILQKYAALTTLPAFAALWVFSKNDWQLEYSQGTTPSTPQNNTIELQEGWNLVSIPQNIVVSEKFFSDALVWKYSENYEWSVNNATLDFPSFETVKQSEGLWVKSDRAMSIEVDKKAAALNTFDSRASMLSYIRNMIEANKYYIGFLPKPDNTPTDAPEDAENATTTNVQELGVDESDILKHDGVYIYSVDNTNEKIIISSFENITKESYAPIEEIDFKGRNILAMYLQNSRLSVVSHVGYSYVFDALIAPQSDGFSLDIFDVSNVKNITNIATHRLEGNYHESRLIAGELYIISQFTPNVSYEYPKKYEETLCSTLSRSSEDNFLWEENNCYQYNYDENGTWKYDYDNPSVVSENLIPMITSNAEEPKELLNPNNFYAPVKLDQQANITTLSHFSIDSGAYNTNSSFLGNTHTYYATQSSLYLVSSEYPLYYDFANYIEQQMIYKFALDATLSYKGRGFVKGRMLNQFSMSEKDDYLRIATTSGWAWMDAGETSNDVYILKNQDKDLVVEGELTGLGHEGETIRAVRFMGERGFVVTFRQTDPLYTLDLSQPQNPRVVGELSIPGFSSYLHIVDANRVLSIGRNADAEGVPQELQFQLFDISDFSRPTLVDKMQIGKANTYSQAEHNHKAFSYRASDLMFGIPYTNYSDYSSSENFGIYQVDALKIVPIDTLSLETSDWGNDGRGIIFDSNKSTYGALFKGSNILSKKLKEEK